VLSPSDPAAAWTAKAHLQVQFAYGLNYLIDTDNAIIVDVEATPARVYDEVRSTRTMLNRTKRRLGIKPKRLAGDTPADAICPRHHRFRISRLTAAALWNKIRT
jgi:hypothetical protein